jgi:uncharacterized protein (DUF983 family)
MPVSYLKAALDGRCPRCREGQVFRHSPLNLTKFSVMNEFCPHCGVRLEPEPGFYQGAMYVGYGFTVGFLIMMSILFYLFLPGRSEWLYIGIFVGFMTLFIPFNYRYSRILYLYLFGGLQKKN